MISDKNKTGQSTKSFMKWLELKISGIHGNRPVAGFALILRNYTVSKFKSYIFFYSVFPLLIREDQDRKKKYQLIKVLKLLTLYTVSLVINK